MIPIRKREHDNKETPSQLLSRLDWQVDKSDRFLIDRINTQIYRTNKPWNGKIDKSTKSFSIVKTRRFLNLYLPLIMVDGRIEGNSSSKIILRYRLGPYTAIFYLFIIAASVLMIVMGFREEKLMDYLIDWILWILVFPVTAIIILVIQLNNIENEINELLGIND